jgi:hypothetical protein
MANSKKKPDLCNHCGGTLMFDGEDVKCLMCGRLAGHHCELCIVKPEKKAVKRERKPASAAGNKHRR